MRRTSGMLSLGRIAVFSVTFALCASTAGQTQDDGLEVLEFDQEESAAPSRNRSVFHPPTGIVTSATFGASIMRTIDKPSDNQTKYTGLAWFLYPTTKSSHLRIRAGIPTIDNQNSRISGSKSPDLLFGAEHEWGWSHFAVTAGLAYMYMSEFEKPSILEYYSSSSAAINGTSIYEQSHATEVVFGIRGGTPTGAFYGRFVWPFPYIFYDEEPDNFFLEYSALGVFGGRRWKMGIGISGFFKRRDAAYVLAGGKKYEYYDQDDYYIYGSSGSSHDYYDYSNTEHREMFVLIPGSRTAFLITDHLVANVTVELGGTIIPRFPDGDDWWKPYVGLGVTYSLGKLDSPVALDGMF